MLSSFLIQVGRTGTLSQSNQSKPKPNSKYLHVRVWLSLMILWAPRGVGAKLHWFCSSRHTGHTQHTQHTQHVCSALGYHHLVLTSSQSWGSAATGLQLHQLRLPVCAQGAAKGSKPQSWAFSSI